MRRLWIAAIFLSLAAVMVAGCSSNSKDKPSSGGSSATAGSGSSAGGDSNDSGGTLQLGNKTVNDHGTKDVSNETSFEIEADDFYFEPSFLQGKPGEKLTLKVGNDSGSLHNISATALGVDMDVAAGTDGEVDITFPQSGVVLFFCKYHTGQGMNGELLVGDATPQPAASSGGSSGGASTTSSDGSY